MQHSSISIYLKPRLLAIAFLGFSSGLPLALTLSTLTVWLTEAGVDKTTIGLFAAIGTPYALKFLWSPFIDGLSLPFFSRWLGRRRGWMVFSQLLLIGAIIGLGTSDPASHPFITALWALCVTFTSATQDIVIDAYRVEILDEREQGAGAALIVFGARIGLLVSGAGALLLAEHINWHMVYFSMAACIGIGVITVLLVGEPKNHRTAEIETLTGTATKRFETWFVHNVLHPFTDFMKRPAWMVILLFVVFYKFGDAFAGVMTNPFLIDTGFSKTEIAAIVKSFGLVATLAGAFIGGTLVHKYGLVPSLWICGILQMFSNLMFALQAHVGHDLYLLGLTISVENLSSGMGTAAFVAYLSSLCHISYTATQYALLSSLTAVGRTWLSASAGWFVVQLDWVYFFVLSTMMALPGLILLVWIVRITRKEELVPQPNLREVGEIG